METHEKRFNEDIAKHEMTIHHVDGLHRHLSFKRPKTFAYSFNITTWPGYLCFSGDMGTFVFSRLPDMFEFFRVDRDINPYYWSEKLTAHDKHGGHREFSERIFVQALKEDFENWDFDNDEARQKAWDIVEEEFSGMSSVDEAISKVNAFTCPVSGQEFIDFWDHNLEDYTFRFYWCCHAIKWAIAQFDAAQPKLPSEVTK